MARRSRAPQAPRPDLGDLLPGAPDQLVGRADLDGLTFDQPSGDVLTLIDATLQSCTLVDARFETADLQGAAVRDVCWEQAELVSLRAWRSRWRDVIVTGGRIGVLEAYTANWNCVALRNVKANFVNLRGSELVDVTFADCQLEELDLSEATGQRVALPGSRIDRLVLHRTNVLDLDLRRAEINELVWVDKLNGVVISTDQAIELAAEFARQAGARIED